MTTAKKKNNALRREDHVGHLDPAYAAALVAKGEETHVHDDNRAFIDGHPEADDFAEELGESTVSAMNSGEQDLAEDLDALVEEEQGGPFVVSSARVEFGEGSDASNPDDATREPFPTT